MGHGLTATDNMAYTGQTPWHSLGVQLPSGSTIQQGAEAAGILWEVQAKPIFYDNGVALVQSEENQALVRQDTGELFAVMGDRYTVVQNRDIVNLLSTIPANFSTIGSLKGGRKLFACFNSPTLSEMTLSDGDQLKSWILGSWGHDGNSPIRFGLTSIRVVCQNTLNMALGDFNGLTIRHMPEAESRLALGVEVMRESLNMFENLREFAEQSKRVAQNEADAISFFKATLGIKAREQIALSAETETSRTLTKLTDLWHTQPGAEANLWGNFNAVTHYVTHEQKQRNGSGGRLNSVLFGRGAQLSNAAYLQAEKILSR